MQECNRLSQRDGGIEDSCILEEILEHNPYIAIRMEGDSGEWKIRYISKNIATYGYDRQDFMTGKISLVDIIHPDDLIPLYEALDEYEKNHVEKYNTFYRLLTAQGDSVWVSDFGTIIYDDSGKALYTDRIISDYTALKSSLDKIEDNYRQQQVLNEILQSLHDSDLDSAFTILLDRTGTYLDISRVILFEDNEDHSACKAVYEWNNTGISSMIEKGRGNFILSYEDDIPDIQAALRKKGMCVVNDGAIPIASAAEFNNEGATASAIFAVYLGKERYGFICFDECVRHRYWEEDVLNFLGSISTLVSTAVMRKKNAEALALSQQTCETVLDNINTFIYVVDPETCKLVFANKAFKNEFSSEYLGQECWRVVNGDVTPHCEECLQKMKSKEHYYVEAYIPQTKEWYGVYSNIISWIDGRSMRLFSTQRITEKKLYEDNIRKMAFIDHLTGLPNRYRCDNDLADAIQDARERGEIGYVVFIDMDDFKIINDGYGHDYGDAILIEFAKFLRTGLPGVYQVYRFGGDEFVLLVRHGHKNDIFKIVNALIRRARMLWKTKDKQFFCTVSVGVVQYPDGGCGVKEIIKNADVAMYQAKTTGKNSFVFYSDQLCNNSIERAEMEKMIREAIADDFKGFRLYYQPIIDVKTKEVIGAEALLRWIAPHGEIIMPKEFIELAEYLGLIVPLGDFVLRESARFLVKMNKVKPRFQVSINVSIRQFQQQDILACMAAILKETGVNCKNLVLEVVEGIAADDMERIIIICNELRAMGLRIAMDDFGKGYSSLNSLRKLPIDIIKINRNFIRDITIDAYAGSFIRLITDLGHSMDREICIKGVETVQQCSYCEKTGVNFLQGFFFAKPMPEEELHRMMEKCPQWSEATDDKP